MNRSLFEQACGKVLNSESKPNGIGTLGEKTLHAVIKNYFEPDPAKHEIKIGSYIADIVNDQGILEVQTRQFNKLRNKLEVFLSVSDVTVIYPVAHTKWLIWIDEQTGETTKKRKSPKTGQPYDILFELYKIKNFLPNPRLKLCIVLLDVEEYRFLNGWSQDKKKGSSRYERIPTGLIDEVSINNRNDYSKLIPEGPAKPFTSKEFAKSAGLSLSTSQAALNVLNFVGAVTRTGKIGNRYVYERTLNKPNGLPLSVQHEIKE